MTPALKKYVEHPRWQERQVGDRHRYQVLEGFVGVVGDSSSSVDMKLLGSVECAGSLACAKIKSHCDGRSGVGWLGGSLVLLVDKEFTLYTARQLRNAVKGVESSQG